MMQCKTDVQIKSAFPMGGREGAARRSLAGEWNGCLVRKFRNSIVTLSLSLFSVPAAYANQDDLQTALSNWKCSLYSDWLPGWTESKDLYFDQGYDYLRFESVDNIKGRLATSFSEIEEVIFMELSWAPNSEFWLGQLFGRLAASVHEEVVNVSEGRREKYVFSVLEANKCVQATIEDPQ